MVVKRERRYRLHVILGVLGVLFLVVGVSYAWFMLTLTGTKTNVLKTGSLSLVLDDSTSAGITVEDAIPTLDAIAMQQTPYGFTLTNNGTIDSEYRIYLDDAALVSGEVRLFNQSLKYQLVKDGVSLKNELFAVAGNHPNRIIDQGIINPGQTFTYDLRVFIHQDAGNEIMDKVFRGKIRVEASQIKPGLAKPNAPQLAGDMLPVIYNETAKSWEKASVDQWYDYDNQKWANAVTIADPSKRATYKTAPAGALIAMDDINTMWVWIPKFEYQIEGTYGKHPDGTVGTKDTPGEIKVNFLNHTYQTASDGYTVHPAFFFDGRNQAGIWIGKFTVTGSIEEACTSTACTAANLTTRPGEAMLTNKTMANFFYAARSMQLATPEKYGFITGNYDVHLLKNCDWAAAAYLSQSKYGKYDNPMYGGTNREVYVNKSTAYITGNSNGNAVEKSATVPQFSYDEITDRGNGLGAAGAGASTTGNIYGIYDMSGGAYTTVMGMHAGEEVASTTSGFLSRPDSKYYDSFDTPQYNGSVYVGQACAGERCYGHALAETNGWYNDYTSTLLMRYNTYFVVRGRYQGYTSNIGIFTYSDFGGQASGLYSTRLVITPE